MDGIFATRSARDVWVTDLVPGRKGETNASTIFNQLYSSASDTFTTLRQEDPHGSVYTTPYSFIALGFYGGNATAVYAPTDETAATVGTAIDTAWFTRRVCAPPALPGVNSTQAEHAWCANRAREWSDRVRINADAGETLTANYKTPGEVEGMLVHPWLAYDGCSGYERMKTEHTTLMRPLEWAFFRPAAAGAAEHVLVLAPGVMRPPIFAVEHRLAPRERFVAVAHSPSGDADAPVKAGVPFRSLDRAPLETDREVPVWGVLHRCTRSNLLNASDAAEGGATNASNESQSAHRCAAEATLRPFAEAIAMVDSEAASRLAEAQMPHALAEALSRLRLWSSDAMVDLSESSRVVARDAGGRVPTRDAVCVLTVARAARDAENGRDHARTRRH